MNKPTFNTNDFKSCVDRGMILIKNREKQMTIEGHIWPINTSSCQWAIEQRIINRAPNQTMMSAVIEYVEKIEFEAEIYNGMVA